LNRIGAVGSVDLMSEAEGLLACFLSDRYGMSFYDLDQTGAWTHGEAQFVFEVRDRIERRTVVQMDRRKVGIR
jgi:hypothetical protein